jgi:hypothetical protein
VNLERAFVDREIALRLARMTVRTRVGSAAKGLSVRSRARVLGAAIGRVVAVLAALAVMSLFVLGSVASRAGEEAERTVERITRDEVDPTPGVVRPAIEDARQAARFSLDRQADMTLASLLLFSGDLDGSWRQLREVVREEPRNADAVYALLFVSRAVDRASVPKLLQRLRQLDPYAWRIARAQAP